MKRFLKGIKNTMNNRYQYTYETNNEYCYPNTSILKNKLNITNETDLYEAEKELVAYQITNLMQNPIKGNFDFNHLKAIHKRLFEKTYDWAGIPRTCAIAKENLFCLPQYIDQYAYNIFSKLEKNKYFIPYDYDEKLNLLIELFADINALHPFRDGNGRTQREFIEQLAKINGIDLDLTKVEKMDMIIASHESINGKYDKLKKMFDKNSKPLSKKEQLHYINRYCSSNIKKNIMEF